MENDKQDKGENGVLVWGMGFPVFSCVVPVSLSCGGIWTPERKEIWEWATWIPREGLRLHLAWLVWEVARDSLWLEQVERGTGSGSWTRQGQGGWCMDSWLLLCGRWGARGGLRAKDVLPSLTFENDRSLLPGFCLSLWNSLSFSVGGTCDLFLTNRMWQSNGVAFPWWRCITQDSVLLADSLSGSCCPWWSRLPEGSLSEETRGLWPTASESWTSQSYCRRETNSANNWSELAGSSRASRGEGSPAGRLAQPGKTLRAGTWLGADQTRPTDTGRWSIFCQFPNIVCGCVCIYMHIHIYGVCCVRIDEISIFTQKSLWPVLIL